MSRVSRSNESHTFQQQTLVSWCLLRQFLLPILLFILPPNQITAQELDEARQDRMPSSTHLVWDNLNGDRQSLRGIRPSRQMGGQLSQLELHPGEWTEFLVPPHEVIRVVSLEKNIDDDLEVWTSNGSGLYRKIVSAISEDRRTLIAAPDESDFSTARVGLALDAACSVKLALFTSRNVEPQRLNYYQCRVLGKNYGVSIRDNNATKKINYTELAPGKVNQIRLKQPTRLRIEARLKYHQYSARQETFWLRVKIDGELHRILTFDTFAQLKTRVFVDDCERLVGNSEFAYIDIGCANAKVDIETSHDVYIRVDGVGLDLCRSRINHIYKLPVVDRNQQIHSYLNSADLNPAKSNLSRHFLKSGNPKVDNIDRSAFDPYLSQQQISELARSNLANRGGLRAYMWMRALATLHYGDAEHRDELSVAELAQRYRYYYTFFRDLLPKTLATDNEISVVDYRRRRLRNIKNKFTEIVIGENHIEDNFELVKSAMLIKQSKHDPQLVYRPAKDLGTSLLRVVIDRQRLNQACKLFVQYDDGLPIEFRVEECAAVPPDQLMPGRDEAAIAVLAKTHARYDRGVLGGPYSQFMSPRPVTLAATADMIIPAGVRQVRVWIDGSDSCTAHVGLQTLDGRVYKLSEQAHRYLRSNRIDSTSRRFQDFIQSTIENETLPFQRLLKSKQFTFSAGVESSEYVAEPTDIWDEDQIAQVLQRAKVSAEKQQWTPAIESLSQIIQHSRGELRQDAIIARINALYSAQEHYLATVEAVGWATHSNDRGFKAQLIEILAKEAALQRDDRLRETYAIVAAINDGSHQNVLKLSRELVEHRRFLFALMVLSNLKSDPSTQDLRLRCAFQLGWWQLFEETLAAVQDPEHKHKWSGLMHLKRGNYLKAKQQLVEAGAAGLPWLEHWKEGDDIFKRLNHRDKGMRQRAIEQWKVWQQANPGPQHWFSQSDCVKKCSGMATVFASLSGTTSQYFLSRPDEPAMLEIEGPCRIKIEARPLHKTPSNDAPINDWLIIHNDAESELIPVINNFSSRLLEIRGAQSERIGELVEAEIKLAPGKNLVRINAEKTDLLFRVLEFQPEIPLSILPRVNRFTVDAINLTGFGGECQICNPESQVCTDCVRLVRQDTKCCSTNLGYQCVCSRLTSPRSTGNSVSNPFHVDGYDTPSRRAIAKLRLSQSPSPADTDAISFLIDVHQIQLDNPDRRDLKRIYDQIRQNFSWQRYRQFDSQAGIHTVKLRHWKPESPELRIRTSLIHAWDWDYALLSANDLEIDVQSEISTRCRISMQRPRISFLPLTETTVQINRPGTDYQKTFRDPNQIVEHDLRLLPGSHQLRLRQDNPTINHFVGVNIFEVLRDGELVEFTDENSPDRQRRFQVATLDEPIKFRVAGPSLIRIDQSDGDANILSSRTVAVGMEGRKFELYPETGQELGYFRIFEMLPTTKSARSYRAEPPADLVRSHAADELVDGVVQQVAYFEEVKTVDTLSLRSPNDPPEEFQINDYNELGLQREGTWFFNVGFQSRRSLAEAPRPEATGRFADLYFGRHYFNPWNDTYSVNQFLIRPRIENGTTFGFQHVGSTTLAFAKCTPDVRSNGWGPYRIGWNGYGFVQNAGTPTQTGVGSNPWIVGGRVRLSRRRQINECWNRRPTVTAFGRYLSEETDGFQAGDLDQDVFTPYKRDHRYGLRFSDTISRQNCLDKRFWFRPYLVTNEDQWIPDNLGLQTGTDHLIGPLQLNLSYRFTQYLVDNDRDLSSIQNVINLEAVLERWHSRRRRSEIRFLIRHDVDDNDGTSFSFNFVNYFNHGRGYRDFDPNQMLFKSLREHRAARHYQSALN